MVRLNRGQIIEILAAMFTQFIKNFFLKIAFNPNFENIPRWKHLLKFVFRVTHESYWFIVPGFYLNPHSIIVSTSQKIHSKVVHVKPIIVSRNHRRFFLYTKDFYSRIITYVLNKRIKRCVQCNKIPDRFKRNYLFCLCIVVLMNLFTRIYSYIWVYSVCKKVALMSENWK